jgi:hypothetical protein
MTIPSGIVRKSMTTRIVDSRFSLSSLVGFVCVVSVGCAALRFASRLWASALLTLLLGALVFSLLGVAFASNSRRRFWAGFSLCGWSYVVLVFGPGLDTHIGHRLLTTKVLGDIQPVVQARNRVPGLRQTPSYRDFDDLVIVSETGTARIRPPQWEHFQQVGHSIIGFMIGIVGGLAGRYFFDIPRPETEDITPSDR